MICWVFFREKEVHEKYLRNIEEDQERDMRELEEKVRDEVSDERFFRKRNFHMNRSRNVENLKLNEEFFNSALSKKSTIYKHICND